MPPPLLLLLGLCAVSAASPRDWVLDRSFAASRAVSEAVFTCPRALGFGPDARWFQLLLQNDVVALRPARRLNASSVAVNLSSLPPSLNSAVFCQRRAAGRTWTSGVAVFRTLPAAGVRLRRVSCPDRLKPPVFSCARWLSVVTNGSVVVYGRENDVSYALSCVDACPRDLVRFGPLVVAASRKATVRCRREWRPFFLDAPQKLEAEATVPEASRGSQLLLLVSAASTDLSRLPAGSELRLACVSEAGVRWEKESGAVPAAQISAFPWGSELRIGSLTAAHEGLISCLVAGQKASVTVALTGRILTPIRPGQSLTLSCCDPGPKQWRFGDLDVTENANSGDCSFLRASQFGTFSCRAASPPRSRFPFGGRLFAAPDRSPRFLLREFVVVASENQFDPSLQLSGVGAGSEVRVDLSRTGGEVAVVMAEDRDAGDAGKVAGCEVVCEPRLWRQCPVFAERRRTERWVFGSISTPERGEFEARRLALVCRDSGHPVRRGTLVFTVVNCRGCGAQASAVVDEEVTALVMDVVTLRPNDTEQFAARLENCTKKAETMTPFQLQLSIKTTDSLIAKANATSQAAVRKAVATTVLQSLSHVSEAPQRALDKVTGGSASVLASCERLSTLLPANGSGSVVASSAMAVGAVAADRSSPRFVRFSVPAAGGAEDARISEEEEEEASAVVSIAIDQRQVASENVRFNFYSTAKLFKASPDVRVASPVIAARARFNHSFSKPPVRLLFNLSARADECSGQQTECAFYNFTTHTWQSAGCSWSTVDGATRCSCTHLTNFALILRLHDHPLPLVHRRVLSALSILLLVFSIAALALTCAVYCSYLRRKQSKARSGHTQHAAKATVSSSRVHIAFCANLLASLAFFLVTGEYRAPGVGCEVIGAMHHFLLLAVFAWSVVEGAHIYAAIIHMALRANSFSQDVRKFFLKAALGAWGVPALVVVVLFATAHSRAYGACHSSTGAESLCFFKGRLFYYLFFILPVCCCLLANLVILGLLAFVLRFRVGVSNLSESKKRKSKRKIIGFVGVFLVLNGTWIVGFLNVGPLRLVGNYLFVIVNGLQGTLVFLWYCVFQEGVRKHMSKHIPCLRWIAPGEDSSIVATSSAVYSARPSAVSLSTSRPRRGEASVALLRKCSSQSLEMLDK